MQVAGDWIGAQMEERRRDSIATCQLFRARE